MVLLFFEAVEQRKKECLLRHFRFLRVAEDRYGHGNIVLCFVAKVCVHASIRMYARLNLNLIL